MAKTTIIVLALIALTGFLALVGALTMQTSGTLSAQPTQQAVLVPIFVEEESQYFPGEEEPIFETPGQIPPMGTPTETGLLPRDMLFWVNKLRVPHAPYHPYNFIPLDKNDPKTFSGSLGPYTRDPRQYLTIHLCQERVDPPITPPVCEKIESLGFYDNYVNWARGYDYDEFPGYQHPPKNWVAYYTIRTDGLVKEGPRAYIRLVTD
jgi:hypothetical protein